MTLLWRTSSSMALTSCPTASKSRLVSDGDNNDDHAILTLIIIIGTWIIVHWEILSFPKEKREFGNYPAGQEPALRIRVKKIQVHLGGVKIHVKEAKHDKLLNFFTGMFA